MPLEKSAVALNSSERMPLLIAGTLRPFGFLGNFGIRFGRLLLVLGTYSLILPSLAIGFQPPSLQHIDLLQISQVDYGQLWKY